MDDAGEFLGIVGVGMAREATRPTVRGKRVSPRQNTTREALPGSSERAHCKGGSLPR
jgi:hypothetical protein